MADINQVQLPDGSQYNITDTASGYATQSYVQSAISGITKATIGLGNVDNTSDANKPVSTAQQTALDAKTNTSVIAYTEASTTATKRYEIGDQFILSGVLYTATAIIANGGTITVGTNCTASDTIIEQLANIGGSADNITFDNAGTGLVSENVEDAIKEVDAKTQHGVFELWTNPSPTNAFAGQTINITQTDLDNRGLNVNINDIDAVDIDFGLGNSSILLLRILVGASAIANYTATDGTSTVIFAQRSTITVSRNNNTISISIPDCITYQIVPQGSSSILNNWLVPLMITGLIHNN